jgi:hypothetical protein
LSGANLQKVLQSYCVLPKKVQKGRAKVRHFVTFARQRREIVLHACFLLVAGAGTAIL